MGEVYLSSVMEYINAYYTDKLSNLHTAFEVESYVDCLLCGDSNRLIEVLQNIMENALKYGDGKYITISFSTEEDCCLITVKNSGCTLKEDELPHLTAEATWEMRKAQGLDFTYADSLCT